MANHFFIDCRRAFLVSAGMGREGREGMTNSPRSGPGSQSMRPHYGWCPQVSDEYKKSRVDWIAGLEGKRDTEDWKRQREGRRGRTAKGWRGQEEGTAHEQEDSRKSEQGRKEKRRDRGGGAQRGHAR